MRALRYRGPILVILACLVVATAAWADVLLMDFAGFDWFWPADIGQPGSCYAAVGFVNAFNPTYVNYDFSTYEYTFSLDYACFVSADSSFFPFVVYTYDTSTSGFRVYCDSLANNSDGLDGEYGTFPPNGTSPSTFEDGECILEASWSGDLTIFLDTTTMNGNINGELIWDGGTQLGNIPVDQRDMSLAIGAITFDPPGGPEGYHWQIDGSIFIQDPVAVEPTTWGAIKKDLGGN